MESIHNKPLTEIQLRDLMLGRIKHRVERDYEL